MRDYFKNDYQKYLIIIGMSFLISLAFTSPLVTGLTNDKEVFRYIAMSVSKGFIPYVDTTEMRPPIIFFLGAPFAGSEWSFWFLFSMVTAIAGIAFYKIALSLGTKYPYLCTAIYFLLLGWPKLDVGGMRAYDLTAAFTTIITLLYLFRKKHSLILLGTSLAIVFFTQQNDILHLLPVTLYAIFTRIAPSQKRAEQIKKALINCFQVAFGFLCFSSLVLLYLWYHGALASFINYTILFAPQNYITIIPSINLRLFHTYNLMTRTELLPVLLVFVLCNLCFAVRNALDNKLRTVTMVTAAALVLAFVTANISGRYYPQHLVSCCLYFAIHIALFTSYAGSKTIYKALSYLLALGILISSIFFAWDNKREQLCEQHGQRILDRPFSEQLAAFYYSTTHNILEPYEKMFADVKGQDGQLYIIGDIRAGLLALNTNLKIVAPSKWYGNLYLLPESMLANCQTVIFDQIEKKKTKYIIDFTDDKTFKSAERQHLWQQLLDKNYTKKAPLTWDATNGWIYVRKEGDRS